MMTARVWTLLLTGALIGASALHSGIAYGETADALKVDARWAPPTLEQVAQQLGSASEGLGVSDEVRRAALEQLASEFPEDAIDAFFSVAAQLMPALAEVSERLRVSPEFYGDEIAERLPAAVRRNVALWVGRELVRRRMFDEALVHLNPLAPDEVVDPAGLLFYRASARHALLQKDPALADLQLLLEAKDRLPLRFRHTAQLMLADLEPLEEDSLDEISRLMSDVSRRLELGRAGEKVVQREQEVIDKLKKLIDQAEQQRQQQQQQQQQQQSSGQGGSANPSGGAPMEDSRIAGASGSGEVDQKDLGQRTDWGALPPAEREETLQQLSRELPTHYREAIEAYFQKLATDAVPGS